jgi:hypothetical protein
MNLRSFEGRHFQPHGLGLTRDPQDTQKIIVAAVNHDFFKGDSIELFDFKPESTVLNHYETVRDTKLLYYANDVAPVNRHQFYATNDCKYCSGFWMYVEKFMAQPWSYLVYREEDGKLKYVYTASDILTYLILKSYA